MCKVTSVTFFLFAVCAFVNSTQSTPEKFTGDFVVSNTSLKALQDIVRLDPAFVFITLNFTNIDFDSETACVNDTPSMIDPLTWTWAKKGKGYFLRSLPPNFLYLSLRTLQSDVYILPIDVVADDSDGFLHENDSVKLQRLAEFLNNVFSHAYIMANSQTQSVYKVCQELFSPPSDSSIQCWSSIDNIGYTETNDSVNLKPFAIFIVLMFLPILLSSCLLRHNLPSKVGQYDVASYPPVGLKYCLLYWKNKEYPVLFPIRVIAVFSILIMLRYVDDFTLRISDDTYEEHLKSSCRFAVNRNIYRGFTVSFLYLTVITFLLFFMRPAFYRFSKCFKNSEGQPFDEDQLRSDNVIDLCLETDEERAQVLGNMSEETTVPKAPDHWSWCDKFYHYMKHRMLMPLNYRIIWSLTCLVFSDDKWRWRNTCGRFCLNLIRLPVALVVLVYVTVGYNPVMYTLIQGIYKPVIAIKPIIPFSVAMEQEMFGKIAWVVLNVFALLCAMWASSSMFYLIWSTFIEISWLSINLFTSIFSGLVINYSTLDPFFFMVLSFIFYCFKTNTDFFNGYCQLKNTIIKLELREVQQGNASNEVQQGHANDEVQQGHADNEVQKGHADNEVQQGHADDAVQQGNAYDGVQQGSADDEPTISDDYFWFIVDKCKPLRVEVASRLLCLALIYVLMYSTLMILKEVGSFVDNTDSFFTFIAVVITFVLPGLENVLDSEEKGLKKKQLKKKIKDAMDDYNKVREKRKNAQDNARARAAPRNAQENAETRAAPGNAQDNAETTALLQDYAETRAAPGNAQDTAETRTRHGNSQDNLATRALLQTQLHDNLKRRALLQNNAETRAETGNAQDNTNTRAAPGNAQDNTNTRAAPGNAQDNTKTRAAPGNGQDNMETRAAPGNAQDNTTTRAAPGNAQDNMETRAAPGNAHIVEVYEPVTAP